MYMYVQNSLKYTPPRVDYYKFKVLPCKQAPPGHSGSGQEKEGVLTTTSLELEFHLQFPCGSPSIEL